MINSENFRSITTKVVDGVLDAISKAIRKGGLCYEPFSGSGSQIVAGESTRRRVYAMEIGSAYVDVAVMRWQKVTGNEATSDGDGQTFDEVSMSRKAGEDAVDAA